MCAAGPTETGSSRTMRPAVAGSLYAVLEWWWCWDDDLMRLDAAAVVCFNGERHDCWAPPSRPQLSLRPRDDGEVRPEMYADACGDERLCSLEGDMDRVKDDDVTLLAWPDCSELSMLDDVAERSGWDAAARAAT